MKTSADETTNDLRLRVLEDTTAIQRLMATYGECVDNNYDLSGLKKLLTSDLEWKSNAFGEYANRDEYLAGQERIGKGVAWAFHVMVPVHIDVQDDQAQGTFYLLLLATFLSAADGSKAPVVVTARYDNTFVRLADGWKCNKMKVNFHQVSRITEGWVDEPFWQG